LTYKASIVETIRCAPRAAMRRTQGRIRHWVLGEDGQTPVCRQTSGTGEVWTVDGVGDVVAFPTFPHCLKDLWLAYLRKFHSKI